MHQDLFKTYYLAFPITTTQTMWCETKCWTLASVRMQGFRFIHSPNPNQSSYLVSVCTLENSLTIQHPINNPRRKENATFLGGSWRMKYVSILKSNIVSILMVFLYLEYLMDIQVYSPFLFFFPCLTLGFSVLCCFLSFFLYSSLFCLVMPFGFLHVFCTFFCKRPICLSRVFRILSQGNTKVIGSHG